MGHAYKLFFVFRPLIWSLVALMVVAFGRRFLKGLLNIIAIFLFVISIGGCVLMEQYIKKVADPFSFATADDWTKCIVGTVTIICFLVFALAYMFMSQAIDGKERKVSKLTAFFQKITAGMLLFILPFAIMGYCLPFFLLDSVAGIIVGVIGEGVGLMIAIAIIRSFKRKKDEPKDPSFDQNVDESL